MSLIQAIADAVFTFVDRFTTDKIDYIDGAISDCLQSDDSRLDYLDGKISDCLQSTDWQDMRDELTDARIQNLDNIDDHTLGYLDGYISDCMQKTDYDYEGTFKSIQQISSSYYFSSAGHHSVTHTITSVSTSNTFLTHSFYYTDYYSGYCKVTLTDSTTVTVDVYGGGGKTLYYNIFVVEGY